MVDQKENKTTEKSMKQKLEIRSINSITVLSLIQTQKLDLSEYLLYVYLNLLDFWLFILQNTKNKTINKYFLVIFLSLVRNRITQ